MKKEIIKLTCRKCGKAFTAYKPHDNEHNVVRCPECDSKIRIMLNPVEIKTAASETAASQQSILSMPGKPLDVPGHEHVYYIKKEFYVGEKYMMECPECGMKVMKKVTASGNQKWNCPQCKTIMAFKAVNEKNKENAGDKTPARKPTQKLKGESFDSMGELVWGHFFSPKKFKLRTGSIIIGRKDDEAPSDLSVNDKYMSRRTALLETIRGNTGYTFKFTVLKKSNPVFVNSNEITAGSSIFLNYGDNITLGKTTFTFRKIK